MIEIELHWINDWTGDDIGFPEIERVGEYHIYTAEGQTFSLYLDLDTGFVLKAEIYDIELEEVFNEIDEIDFDDLEWRDLYE